MSTLGWLPSVSSTVFVVATLIEAICRSQQRKFCVRAPAIYYVNIGIEEFGKAGLDGSRK
jgi:hypothetical protein